MSFSFLKPSPPIHTHTHILLGLNFPVVESLWGPSRLFQKWACKLKLSWKVSFPVAKYSSRKAMAVEAAGSVTKSSFPDLKSQL